MIDCLSSVDDPNRGSADGDITDTRCETRILFLQNVGKDVDRDVDARRVETDCKDPS